MWRVIWQHNATVVGAVTADIATDSLEAAYSTQPLWRDLDTLGSAEPIFQEHASNLRASITQFPQLIADPAMDLAGYFHIFVATFQQAVVLVGRLRAQATVSYAEIQARPRHPVMFGQTRRLQTLDKSLVASPAQTPPLVGEQGYLKPAPDGVDALFAWNLSGGQGAGIRICDVESGWNFDHEDLLVNDSGLIYGQNDYVHYNDGTDSDTHGTAVLGIFHGDKNSFGVTGIAADALVSGASAIYDAQLYKWNAAAAIKYATDHWLGPGDVMLLEMHAPGPNTTHPDDQNSQQGYIPIEYWLPEFSAIKYAVAKGIHVVEAAGNGAENLDAAIYASAFSKATRDSGAIIVGGGNSAHDAHPRSRIWWSNYGSRLDVQGWGYDIVTTGGRETPHYYDRIKDANSSKCYTQSFGGTSGASPIVVGVVSCISGAMRAAGKPALTPHEMRALLARTGTSQTDAPGFSRAQQIGPLPNLKAALSEVGLGPAVNKTLA